MLKPFSASEAPHTMAESTEESNVLFKKEKEKKKKTHGEMDLILSAQRKQKHKLGQSVSVQQSRSFTG